MSRRQNYAILAAGATATSVTLKQIPRSDHGVHVDIRITADLNVSAYVAQRQVTAYLVDNVSDHLSGEAPMNSLPVPHHRQTQRADCLPACVAMVLDYLGRPLDYDTLLRTLGNRYIVIEPA